MPLLRIVAAGLAAIALPSAAWAESWGVGDPLRWPLPEVAAERQLSLEFTPRVGGLSLDGVRLNLSLGSFSVGEAGANLGATRLRALDDERRGGGLVLGGALAIDDVVVAAHLAQRDAVFGHGDTWRAALSAGGVTTALSYTDGLGSSAGQRFAVGTAIEAAPGISLGADVALDDGTRRDGAGDAQGVLRFKLEF